MEIKPLSIQLKYIVEKEYIRWFTISFINGIFNKFCKFINGICYRVIAHYSINKLNKFIRIPKDPLPKFAKRNVVYQIDVGIAMILSTQVKREKKLKLRLAEHRNHRVTSIRSVITNHRVSCNHDFDWDNMRILDSERNYNKRMSEMLYINRQSNSLNMQTDTEALNHRYIEILNKL